MERGLASGPCPATMAMVTLANAPPPVPVGMVTQAEVQGALVASPAGTPGVDSVNHYRLRMTRGYAPRVPPRASLVPLACLPRIPRVHHSFLPGTLLLQDKLSSMACSRHTHMLQAEYHNVHSTRILNRDFLCLLPQPWADR